MSQSVSGASHRKYIVFVLVLSENSHLASEKKKGQILLTNTQTFQYKVYFS